MTFRSFVCLSVLAGTHALVFSPYKDVNVNMNWNTIVISSTSVEGDLQPLISVLPSSGADTITWAFANGDCGSESWGGIGGSILAEANIKSWANSGLKYIISTGGPYGSFKCISDGDFETFINRYNSNTMIGVDFDIEHGMNEDDINNLVQRVKNAQSKYSNLRFSFTLACFGGNANPMLGDLGNMTMNAINSLGLKNYFINLKVMDYGATMSNFCVVNGDHCDMGMSAANAAVNLNAQYGVPFDHIELTPMIGGNDVLDEVFTLKDIDVVTAFALQNNLGGIHHWSFDRDKDCAPGYVSPTCNSYGKAGVLGFTKKFASNLNLPPTPMVPTPQTVPSPQTTSESQCAQNNCHGGACLWVYATGATCFTSYPKESCDAYAAQGYTWCA